MITASYNRPSVVKNIEPNKVSFLFAIQPYFVNKLLLITIQNRNHELPFLSLSRQRYDSDITSIFTVFNNINKNSLPRIRE